MSCLIIDPYVRANTSAFICSNCGTPGAFGARNLGVFICSALPIGFIVCCLYYFVILYQLPHFTSIHPTRTHVHTHAHMHVRTNIHTLAHTHTLLHTHTHTRKPRKLFPYLFWLRRLHRCSRWVEIEMLVWHLRDTLCEKNDSSDHTPNCIEDLARPNRHSSIPCSRLSPLWSEANAYSPRPCISQEAWTALESETGKVRAWQRVLLRKLCGLCLQKSDFSNNELGAMLEARLNVYVILKREKNFDSVLVCVHRNVCTAWRTAIFGHASLTPSPVITLSLMSHAFCVLCTHLLCVVHMPSVCCAHVFCVLCTCLLCVVHTSLLCAWVSACVWGGGGQTCVTNQVLVVLFMGRCTTRPNNRRSAMESSRMERKAIATQKEPVSIVYCTYTVHHISCVMTKMYRIC